MESQGQGGVPAADWHPDPLGRHELRYWDGAAWTDSVSDGGEMSVDPVDGQSAAAGGETVLMTLPRVSDVMWGGSMNVYLTDRRLVVEPVLGTGAVIGAGLAGGVVGVAIARNAAEKKRDRDLDGQVRTLDEILRTTNNAYAVEYSDIAEMVLTKKALPIGHSRCKIRSAHKDVTLAFKREMFDEVSAMLAGRLPGVAVVK